MELNRNFVAGEFQNKTIIFVLTFATCFFIWFGFSRNITVSIIGWMLALCSFRLLDTTLSTSRKILKGDFYILKSRILGVDDETINTDIEEIPAALVLGNNFERDDEVFMFFIDNIVVSIYGCDEYSLDEDLKGFLKNN